MNQRSLNMSSQPKVDGGGGGRSGRRGGRGRGGRGVRGKGGGQNPEGNQHQSSYKRLIQKETAPKKETLPVKEEPRQQKLAIVNRSSRKI